MHKLLHSRYLCRRVASLRVAQKHWTLLPSSIVLPGQSSKIPGPPPAVGHCPWVVPAGLLWQPVQFSLLQLLQHHVPFATVFGRPPPSGVVGTQPVITTATVQMKRAWTTFLVIPRSFMSWLLSWFMLCGCKASSKWSGVAWSAFNTHRTPRRLGQRPPTSRASG